MESILSKRVPRHDCQPCRRRERGAAAAEFAIILPVFFLLVMGAVDFGRAFWTKNTLANVAREATRYASVRSLRSQDPATLTKIKGVILGQSGPLDPEKMVVTASWTPTNNPGGSVRVDVSYPFEPVLPLLFFESIGMTSSSTMIVSY
jgi:Flp pilus assembly protein TadG